MRTGLTPQEVRGPQRTEPLAIRGEERSGKPMGLLGLENSIAALDRSQSKAVIETVDGVQRIRGLAGSGKTIVLLEAIDASKVLSIC